MKQIRLETPDGFALLGYAGLGLTEFGNQPSHWISNTLRGRNLGLEQMLGILADTVRAKLPKHLDTIGGAHAIIIPAIVNNKPRMYAIELLRMPGQSEYSCMFRRVVKNPEDKESDWITQKLAITGSGMTTLPSRERMGAIGKLVADHDAGNVPPDRVAEELAWLNADVATRDRFVSPRCIVTWHAPGKGGGVAFFTGTKREYCPGIPTISHGTDLAALVGVMMPHLLPGRGAFLRGETVSEPDPESINADLAKLPVQPDDNLD